MKERLQAVADFAPEVKGYLKNGGQVVQQAVFNDKKLPITMPYCQRNSGHVMKKLPMNNESIK